MFQIEAYFDDISCIIIDNDRNSIEVRDEMLIEEIFNSYYPFHSSESSDYSVEIVFNDDERRHLYGSFLIGQVPDAIIDLFEDHLTPKDFINNWDLDRLKGKQVDVQVYALSEGLPGQGENSEYTYDSDLILLLENGRTF